MKNGTAIILVVLLSIVLIGLLIYGFVFLPKKQNKILPTPNTPNNNTGTNTSGGNTTTPITTPTITASQYIKDLAQEFRTQFQCSACASNRCTVIGKVNALSNLDLVVFFDYYKTKFGITPYQEMDNAWVWCAINNVDDTLFSKLSALELS